VRLVGLGGPKKLGKKRTHVPGRLHVSLAICSWITPCTCSMCESHLSVINLKLVLSKHVSIIDTLI
jgi:hypothetical protein